MEKVILRAMEPEDLDFLYMIENDITLWDVSSTNMYYSRYLLRDYVARCTGDIYTDKQLRLVAEDADGEIVGIVDLVNFEPRHQRAEVGIVIRKNCRGKGYGQQALLQLTDYARRILHLHQLYVYVDADNETSMRLFEHAGFRRTTVLKDWLCLENNYRDVVFMQYFL